MVRVGSAQRQRRLTRRVFAPLAGAALVVAAALERLRRRRQKEPSKGGVHVLEANKLIARRIIEEAFTEGRYEIIDEVVAPTFVNHDPFVRDDAVGREGMRQLIDTYRSGFPDVRLTIEDQVAERDLVATRWSARGTHQGPLLGIEPTGKQATVTGITISRIENGKIVESWNNWDTLGLLQQLGVAPAMAGA